MFRFTCNPGLMAQIIKNKHTVGRQFSAAGATVFDAFISRKVFVQSTFVGSAAAAAATAAAGIDSCPIAYSSHRNATCSVRIYTRNAVQPPYSHG